MTDKTIIESSKPGNEAEKTIFEPLVDPTIREDIKATGMESKNFASIGLVPGEMIGGCKLDEPLKVTSGEADLWIATQLSDRRKIVAKIYRWGMRPKVDVREKISKVAVKHIVELLGHGQYGEGRHYELLEYIEYGTLTQWARNGLPKTEIKDILRDLADAIIALHEVNIIHRDIKPDNVLVRSKKPLNLVLTDFGISSVVDLSLHQTSMNRTAAYASPESLTGVIGKPSDWWSLGVIILELLDKNPFTGIDERAINFGLSVRGISVPNTLSEEWQLLLRGLLTRDNEKRWGAEQVSSWLNGKRDISVYFEESKATADMEAKRPYKLAGKEHRTAAELGRAVAENWSEAVKHLARGMLTDWVKIDLRDQDMANQLLDLVEDKNLAGEMKVALAGMILNRDVPITWQGEIVGPEWMARHHDLAVSILKSHMPEWVYRLRSESWLLELRGWRDKVLSHIMQSGASCNQKLVDQMVVSPAEIVESLAMEVLDSYVSSANTAIDTLFRKKSLLAEDKVLLAACDRNLLVSKAQWQEWERETLEIREWAQKYGISLDEELLTKAVRLQGNALREAATKLRSQYANSSVEELRNILANNTLTDREERLLIACDRTLFFTKEQWQERELKRKKNELRELAEELTIGIDDNLLEKAVNLEGGSLRQAVNTLRAQYSSASVEKLRNILTSDEISDQEARLLLSSNRDLLLSKTELENRKRAVYQKSQVIGAVLGATIGMFYGIDLVLSWWTIFIVLVALTFALVGGVIGFVLGGIISYGIQPYIGKGYGAVVGKGIGKTIITIIKFVIKSFSGKGPVTVIGTLIGTVIGHLIVPYIGILIGVVIGYFIGDIVEKKIKNDSK